MDITEKQVFDYIFPLKRAGLANEELVPYIEQFIELFDGAICTKRVKELVVKAGEIYDKESENVNLSQDIFDFISVTKGYFSVTDVYNALHLVTKKAKTNARVILYRFVKKDILERHDTKNGCFRLIDNIAEVIEWEKDQGQVLNIALPLGLDDLVNVYPGNIIVVAGMSNAGKTALLLNIAGLNLDKFKGKMHYFSSEMGPCELKTRIDKFKLPHEVWRGCIFREKSIDFSDVIEPGCINIIDYMEVLENAYEIGKKIKKIHDKLKNGIAVIAIQKNKHKELGVGSTYSLEKPRLYLTMDEVKGKIYVNIIKAKNWKTDLNPNGLRKEVEIIDGYQFKELKDWQIPNKE